MSHTSRRSWLPTRLVDWLGSALFSVVVGSIAPYLWNAAVNVISRPDLVVPWQAGLVTMLGVLFAVWAARRFPLVANVLERGWISLAYVIRMAPFWAHEAIARGEPGRGKRNQRYPSEALFYAANRQRETTDQVDHGQHWQDPYLGPCRLTWISSTGELIAVAHNKGGAQGLASLGRETPRVVRVAEIIVEPLEQVAPGSMTRPGRDGGPVEIIASIADEDECNRLLVDYEYVSRGDLRWARRRAHGWMVPLPPDAEWWKRFTRRPEPLPAPPPPPSLGEPEGAYVGIWERDGAHVQIKIGNEPANALYHFVDSAPTGFGWGYGGSGPWDLSRSILADRLGYIPNGDVIMQFKNKVIAKLTMPAFSLTFAEVDTWIDSHHALFAREPRASWPQRQPARDHQSVTIVRSATPEEVSAMRRNDKESDD